MCKSRKILPASWDSWINRLGIMSIIIIIDYLGQFFFNIWNHLTKNFGSDLIGKKWIWVYFLIYYILKQKSVNHTVWLLSFSCSTHSLAENLVGSTLKHMQNSRTSHHSLMPTALRATIIAKIYQFSLWFSLIPSLPTYSYNSAIRVILFVLLSNRIASLL